jgi:uncharacterized protein (DUF433 family)
MMMTDWREQIVIDANIQQGTPVLKDTRVSVQVVVGALASGMTFAEVCDQYRLTPEQIQAALSYAAETIEQEKVYAMVSR